MVKEETAVILQMQNYSIHDGDGVRTTVFFAGCRLRCQWCANPESWTDKPKLAFHQSRCVECGLCQLGCDRNLQPTNISSLSGCDACGNCVDSCPHDALSLTGTECSVEDVVQRATEQSVFYRFSGGGVTLSGGEPFLQHRFLNHLVPSLTRIGISLWAETCGYFDMEKVRHLISDFEHIFIDIKHMDPAHHHRLTGRNNRRILRNIIEIHKLGIPVTVRVPLIPGVNDDEVNLRDTALFMANNLAGAEIEILPYHSLGEGKYTTLGMKDQCHTFTPPLQDSVERSYRYFTDLGIHRRTD
ncbi:glycyl-radical enzyme activating protein [Vibrio sp.]|nr:glycyl-radical enzyme activating protein [Vibrio sp.]